MNNLTKEGIYLLYICSLEHQKDWDSEPFIQVDISLLGRDVLVPCWHGLVSLHTRVDLEHISGPHQLM